MLLMTKTPGRQPIKTRLAVTLGTTVAEALYCAFLRDLGAMLHRLGLPLRLHALPADAEACAVLTALLGPAQAFASQQGADLGQRMQAAFECGFAAGCAQLVLIGGDAPLAVAQQLPAAFAALEDQGCTLGPTADGGYYLIGFTAGSFAPTVFDFAEWGAATVYAETLQRLQQVACRCLPLAPGRDVDTLADLIALWRALEASAAAGDATLPATWARLQALWPEGPPQPAGAGR